MTLAVVARFPWGQAAAHAQAVGRLVPQAVIFAADSRFTSVSGNILQDDGKKLYRVANDAAVAYAGDVIAAQHAIREIKKYFGRRSPTRRVGATGFVARIIRTMYAHEAQRRDE